MGAGDWATLPSKADAKLLRTSLPGAHGSGDAVAAMSIPYPFRFYGAGPTQYIDDRLAYELTFTAPPTAGQKAELATEVGRATVDGHLAWGGHWLWARAVRRTTPSTPQATHRGPACRRHGTGPIATLGVEPGPHFKRFVRGA